MESDEERGEAENQSEIDLDRDVTNNLNNRGESSAQYGNSRTRNDHEAPLHSTSYLVSIPREQPISVPALYGVYDVQYNVMQVECDDPDVECDDEQVVDEELMRVENTMKQASQTVGHDYKYEKN